MNRLLFSDRFWFLKLLLSLLVFSWLGTHATRLIGENSPPIERVAVFHEKYRGRPVHISGTRVLSSGPGRFTVHDPKAGNLVILAPDPPEAGRLVTVRGRVAGSRTVEAIRWRFSDGYRWKRPLNYVVSVATLLLFLWIIRRRFRWAPERGVLRARY